MGNKTTATREAKHTRILNYTISSSVDGFSVDDGFGGCFGTFKTLPIAKAYVQKLIAAHIRHAAERQAILNARCAEILSRKNGAQI